MKKINNIIDLNSHETSTHDEKDNYLISLVD